MKINLNDGDLVNKDDVIEQIVDEVRNSDIHKVLDEESRTKKSYMGMEFDSSDATLSYYKSYAKLEGFGISTKASRQSKVTGEFIDMKKVPEKLGYVIRKDEDFMGVEVLGAFGCHHVDKQDGLITNHKIRDLEKNKDFSVWWDANNEEISCLCRLFEHSGFLRRHSLYACSTFHLDIF
ncbi:hypothetical protein Tsubulata_051589, partial [Turnera subulata]